MPRRKRAVDAVRYAVDPLEVRAGARVCMDVQLSDLEQLINLLDQEAQQLAAEYERTGSLPEPDLKRYRRDAAMLEAFRKAQADIYRDLVDDLQQGFFDDVLMGRKVKPVMEEYED